MHDPTSFKFFNIANIGIYNGCNKKLVKLPILGIKIQITHSTLYIHILFCFLQVLFVQFTNLSQVTFLWTHEAFGAFKMAALKRERPLSGEDS